MPVAVLALVGSVVVAAIDPAWAVPLQTLLLIVLTVVAGLNQKVIKRTERQNEQLQEAVDNTHEQVLKAKANATHAASAAAAAAATARDSSRIVKDVGSLFRATRDPSSEGDS